MPPAIKKGKIFVISAPSGSGKTTLCSRLLEECENLVFSVSVTTRKRRKGEINKKDYIFVSRKQFRDYLKKGLLLESAKVFEHYYGTPKRFVDASTEKGKSVLLAIDVKGAFKLKKKRPQAILIFILPPSLEELKNRLSKRKTEGRLEIKKRLKIARYEMAQAKKYNYRVINRDLDSAISQLKEIIIKCQQ